MSRRVEGGSIEPKQPRRRFLGINGGRGGISTMRRSGVRPSSGFAHADLSRGRADAAALSGRASASSGRGDDVDSDGRRVLCKGCSGAPGARADERRRYGHPRRHHKHHALADCVCRGSSTVKPQTQLPCECGSARAANGRFSASLLQWHVRLGRRAHVFICTAIGEGRTVVCILQLIVRRWLDRWGRHGRGQVSGRWRGRWRHP